MLMPRKFVAIPCWSMQHRLWNLDAHSFQASWTWMPQCPQYIQAEFRQLVFLRQIVASYILQRGVFLLIVSSSFGGTLRLLPSVGIF